MAQWAVAGGFGGQTELCTEQLALIVEPENCKIQIIDWNQNELIADGSQGGFMRDTAQIDGVQFETVGVARTTPTDEHFYGFGEKTGHLDKRGSSMMFWNTDAYDTTYGGYAPNSDPLYLSIPFYIGLRDGVAYGVFTDNSYRLKMDVAESHPETITVTAYGGVLEQYIIPGPSMAEVVRKYTQLTGRLRLPPRWALGYHQSRWGYAPDSRVMEVAHRFRELDIPADNIFLDIQHQDGRRTFTWDQTQFPDPAQLIRDLLQINFKTTLIEDPGIHVDNSYHAYQSGLAGDHFIHTEQGPIFEGPAWPGFCAFPDFTRPDTRIWWGDLIGDQMDLGVRAIWLDLNEPTLLPEEGGGRTVDISAPVHGEGIPTTMAEVHNVYALFEAMATWDGMQRRFPDRRPFLLSRAGWSGIQKYAAIWTGDVPSTWHGLNESLPMMLNMGLSGLPLIGTDMGGYSGYASPELYARWVALGTISPFFRGHVTNSVNNQEPWEFGVEVTDISKNLFRLRYALLPYWYSLLAEASETGAPPLRPMIYESQETPEFTNLESQAMVGSFMLVAPIMTEGASEKTIYFPAGRWYEFHSGAIVDGPTEITKRVTLGSLPIYIREGAIIPRIEPPEWIAPGEPEIIYLDLFPSYSPTSFTLYSDQGDGFDYQAGEFSKIRYTLIKNNDGAQFDSEKLSGNYTTTYQKLILRFQRIDHPATNVLNGTTELIEYLSYDDLLSAESGWWYDHRNLSLTVLVPFNETIGIYARYNPEIPILNPPVEINVTVTVPEGTPTDTPVHLATEASDWEHTPMEWSSTPNQAHSTIEVPRGEWFFYKYSRGDWCTVEKWPECEEATNRYGFGQAHPDRTDTVFGWRDWCPGSCE